MKKFIGYLILALVFVMMGVLVFLGFYLRGFALLQSIGLTLSLFAISIIIVLAVYIAVELTV